MFLLSLTANSILLFLIISQKSLHSPMYVLIGLMTVVDLLLPIFFVPNMLFSFLFNWGGISLVGCLIQMFCLHFVGAFQTTLLLWMALDRYFAICRPLYYHKYMEIPNFVKFVVLPVIINALLNISMVSLAGKLTFCVTNVIDHCFCEHMALVQLACGAITINNIVGLSTAFLIPTADCILIAASYVVIFASVFRSGKAQMKAINTCITHLIVIPSTEHISPVLQQLHWLPVKYRVEFKILLLTYKALHNLAPQYLSQLLHVYTPSRALRSSSSISLIFYMKCIDHLNLNKGQVDFFIPYFRWHNVKKRSEGLSFVKKSSLNKIHYIIC